MFSLKPNKIHKTQGRELQARSRYLLAALSSAAPCLPSRKQESITCHLRARVEHIAPNQNDGSFSIIDNEYEKHMAGFALPETRHKK